MFLMANLLPFRFCMCFFNRDAVNIVCGGSIRNLLGELVAHFN